jgi:carboxyl-terminal processing protease
VPPPTPAYLPAECDGSTLATVEPAGHLAATAPASANPPIDTATQLGVLDGLNEAVLETYLYRDYGGLDWPSAVAETRSRVAAGVGVEAFYAELGDLVERLGDEHSYFQSPAEIAAEAAELSGQLDFVGIGVWLLPRIERGLLTVLAVFPESSAELGGLEPRDSILAIDGTEIVEGGPAPQILMRGPACSQVVLRVGRPGEPVRDMSFVRASVTGALPLQARLIPTEQGLSIGYLFLPTFLDQSLPGRVEQALQDFGDLDGLILDNRFNGGGLGSVTEEVLALFASGPLGYFVDRKDATLLTVEANAVLNSQVVPLAVLIGEDTVSYGEVFAGILQDIGRARLVGQTTLGNVEQLRAFDFADGSRAWLATHRFDPLNGAPVWEENGIVPDVVVLAAWEDFAADTDPIIAAAVSLLVPP